MSRPGVVINGTSGAKRKRMEEGVAFESRPLYVLSTCRLFKLRRLRVGRVVDGEDGMF